jgi:hypothetical protein
MHQNSTTVDYMLTPYDTPLLILTSQLYSNAILPSYMPHSEPTTSSGSNIDIGEALDTPAMRRYEAMPMQDRGQYKVTNDREKWEPHLL